MVKAIALTFAVGIFKAEQRKAPLPQNFIQAHIVMLVKMLPLKLVRAATGNDLQNKAKRTTRLVSYLTSKMSVHTPKMLALKGQVHKDQENRSLSHLPWSSAQHPSMNNTTHACQEKSTIQHPFFQRGQMAHLNLLGGGSKKGFSK